mmetsp:Transcript_44325/g.139864  ORF Transcript_44325/g.139864 Transcript_44325/m.139864 type:complete len:89 (+) Transcript_44325:732-998(+)
MSQRGKTMIAIRFPITKILHCELSLCNLTQTLANQTIEERSAAVTTGNCRISETCELVLRCLPIKSLLHKLSMLSSSPLSVSTQHACC